MNLLKSSRIASAELRCPSRRSPRRSGVDDLRCRTRFSFSGVQNVMTGPRNNAPSRGGSVVMMTLTPFLCARSNRCRAAALISRRFVTPLTAPHPRDLIRGRRPAEEISLAEVAIALAQKLHLLRIFHALGDHLESEGVGHRDDGGDDRRIAAVRDAGQKTPVDLQRVHRKLLEISERRIPDPEIVDRYAHAAGAQLSNDLNAPLRRAQRRPLGNLDLQNGWPQTVMQNRLIDHLQHVRMLELAR